MKRWRRMIAGALMLALLAGCGKPSPDPAESPIPTLSPEELAAVEKAEALLEGFRWPRETETKTLAGQEVEVVLHHGPGWTIQVPADWEQAYTFDWRAPSGNAGFSVSKWDLPVNNPKIYRAQMGSWRHETDYPAPFDYYYDDDGGYTPPEGSADYIYFFAPDGEDRSYEFTLSLVVGETTEEERAIQEAMLLSFRLDDSSHILYSEEYVPGQTEWEAALTGLLTETEPIWFHLDDNSGVWQDIINGKGNSDCLSHALAVSDYQPGEFVQTLFEKRPEGAPEPGCDMITLCLPEMKMWLYFHEDSPWVCVHHADGDYWTQLRNKDDPDKMIYNTVLDWLEAEQGWAGRPADL